MNVYIVKREYDYEGYEIDSAYASESDAQARAAEIKRIISLPWDHPEKKHMCDSVDVECLEVLP